MSRSDLEDLFLQVPVIPRPRTYNSAGGFINASALDPQTFRRWFRFKQEHLKQLKDGLRIPPGHAERAGCRRAWRGDPSHDTATARLSELVVRPRTSVWVAN
ncbi:hypothetical protein MRX96_017802 [Rhipicephalus microplus]